MTVVLWEVESGKLCRMFIGHDDWVNSVSFSPLGLHIAFGSKDGAVRIWELSSGNSRLLASTVAFSNGLLIASDHGDEYVCIWDARTENLRCMLENDATLVCFAFSSCGKWIATCYGSWVGLWNCVSSYNSNNSSSSNNSSNNNNSDSSNNNNSDSSNNNNNDNSFSEEWKRKALIRGFVDEVTYIAWRPGTLEIVTGSVDGSTHVWRLQTEPEISVEQVWGIRPEALVATDAAFEDAIGLIAVNQILLTQRSTNNDQLFAQVLAFSDSSDEEEE
ncbi:hypothetical protein BGZ96_009835 [Linnemannia gamsii]|uniref:WD40 repeat-like protein n=1 Tax=Linnemannia gamsii TaxID=64522 RepID=A0ABQ7KCA3_9FUNG|nr:hypothetical protein BGZ96_009835 [Linnemannia gamsii]